MFTGSWLFQRPEMNFVSSVFGLCVMSSICNSVISSLSGSCMFMLLLVFMCLCFFSVVQCIALPTLYCLYRCINSVGFCCLVVWQFLFQLFFCVLLFDLFCNDPPPLPPIILSGLATFSMLGCRWAQTQGSPLVSDAIATSLCLVH